MGLMTPEKVMRYRKNPSPKQIGDAIRICPSLNRYITRIISIPPAITVKKSCTKTAVGNIMLFLPFSFLLYGIFIFESFSRSVGLYTLPKITGNTAKASWTSPIKAPPRKEAIHRNANASCETSISRTSSR